MLEVRFGTGADALHVLILHMALGRRGRLRQIEFLAELVRDYRHVILMGDLNCDSDSPEMMALLERRPACASRPRDSFTFPSWRPDRQLDHILVSPSITVERVKYWSTRIRITLPIAMEVRLPKGLRLKPKG
ncbi:MAG: endonuclease/exonuclease/phosphatase family protein [Chromatiales bacterium]|nr:endonuclease/exonuclease/phosphatase family protein [Chromatiales bacterium]